MVETNGYAFQIIVTLTAMKAADGSENQAIISLVTPSFTSSQLTSPKDESNSHAKMTTATTSGTAHGNATRRRAIRRPRNRLFSRSAVPMPMTKQQTVTTTISLSVTQTDCQNSSA